MPGGNSFDSFLRFACSAVGKHVHQAPFCAGRNRPKRKPRPAPSAIADRAGQKKSGQKGIRLKQLRLTQCRTAMRSFSFFQCAFFSLQIILRRSFGYARASKFLRLTPIVTLAARPARNFLLNKKSCSRGGWSHLPSRLLPHFAANFKGACKNHDNSSGN